MYVNADIRPQNRRVASYYFVQSSVAADTCYDKVPLLLRLQDDLLPSMSIASSSSWIALHVVISAPVYRPRPFSAAPPSAFVLASCCCIIHYRSFSISYASLYRPIIVAISQYFRVRREYL